MSLPPPDKLNACLNVLYLASLKARMIGWDGEKEGLPASEAKRLVRLMDAVHNLPHLMRRWEECDEERLRRTLASFDEDFPDKAKPLLSAYENPPER